MSDIAFLVVAPDDLESNAMGGIGGGRARSALFCLLMSLKRCAHSAQAVHARLKPTKCTLYRLINPFSPITVEHLHVDES